MFQGSSNYKQHFSGEVGKQIVQSDMVRRNSSNTVTKLATNQGFNPAIRDEAVLAVNFKKNIGPSEDELTGLNMEERNKRRRGPDTSMGMEIETDNVILYSETGLSYSDCPISSSTVLAKLAEQASQPQ